MKTLVVLSVLSFSLFAGASQVGPTPCVKVAMGAAYNTMMREMPNQWHIVGVTTKQPYVFEVTLHNDEDGYHQFLIATKVEPTAVCHVTALKQEN